MSYPKHFYWGAATSAHQIEGGSVEDGKGLSIWDTHAYDKKIDSRTGRSNIMNGETADIACDHYHRFKEDVQLMKEMGLKAYRFSISWPRVLPQGRGKVNPAGIAFYSSLVDELLAAGIEPFVTLFHWDFPQALQDIGGWANPEMPDIFSEYVKVVVQALSDRVTYWMTLNEPQCHIIIGHIDGECAPKLKVSNSQAFRLIHSLLKAHGKAVKTIRQYAIKTPSIGIAPNPQAFYPSSTSKEDIDAAKTMAFQASDRNFWQTTWWLDPVILGRYPEDGMKAYGEDFPADMIKPGDMELISQPMDFLGINLYQGREVKADENGTPVLVPRKPGFELTAFKWGVTPNIMHHMPNFLYERYQLPILITENGLSLSDWVTLEGEIPDLLRIDFMHRYLSELKKSIQDGTPVLGYFAWSFLDNYEWSNGYTERFGLVHVDYETQKRTKKASAYWYSKMIETNGEAL